MKPIDYAGLLEDKDKECLVLRARLKQVALELERIASEYCKEDNEVPWKPNVYFELRELAKELKSNE